MESTSDNTCLTNETVLIPSVICSKKVRLIAQINTSIKGGEYCNPQFVPDIQSIQINGTLLNDLIIMQGYIKGNIIINGKCIKGVTLAFQEEIVCEGICPGDILKHTNPILAGVLPPQIIPDDDPSCNRIILKTILSIQVTVVRERLGKISVQIIGDINENRCQDPIVPTIMVTCEGKNDRCEDHHHNNHSKKQYTNMYKDITKSIYSGNQSSDDCSHPDNDYPCDCDNCKN